MTTARPTTMRMLISLVAVLLTLTACSEDRNQPNATTDGGLALQLTYAPGPVVPLEGAEGEVRLTDAAGRERVIRTRFDNPEIVLDDLTPGRYEVVAGLRICDGNDCEAPLTDTCETSVSVLAATTLRIRYVPGESCQVDSA